MASKNQEIEKMDEAKNSIRLWVMIVYGAGVAFATAFNESLMLSVFNSDNVMKYIAFMAVILIASNALLFPSALHNWAVSGKHRGWTIVFYVLDMAFLTVNTVVSFSKQSSIMPAWAVSYLPYAPASMVIQGVVSWAIIMIMDPGQKSKVKLAEAWQDAEIEVTKLMVDWLGSDEGKGVLREAAGVMVGDMFNVRTLSGKSNVVTAKASGNSGNQDSDTLMSHIIDGLPESLRKRLEVPEPVSDKGNHNHPS